MNDLGPDARSIVEAARGAETLARDNRSRIKHAVLIQAAALGAASTAAGGAIAMSMATKVTLVVVTATALGGGAYSLWTWKTQATAPVATAARTESTPARRPIALPSSPAVVVEPRAKPAPPEVRRRDGARGEARRPVPAPAPAFESPSAPSPARAAPVPVANRALQSLSPELTMLRQAQEDLRAGLPAQALRRLEGYDRRFAKGTLDQERQAIEAIARCQIRLDPAAQARADRFLRLSPESPLAERVRAACKKSERDGRSFNETEQGREP